MKRRISHQVRLQGITADGRIETPAAAVDAGMDLPTPLDLPQLVPTAVPVKPDLPSAAVSGPQQVSQMVTDTEANGVTSTVDLTELMQLLNSNANVLSVSDGSQSMYSLNIEPRPTPVCLFEQLPTFFGGASTSLLEQPAGLLWCHGSWRMPVTQSTCSGFTVLLAIL